MSSIAKKKKAKNSYLHNGGEKNKKGRMKRIYYFTKAQRLKLKQEIAIESEE